jgi:hypothetical protein
MAGHMDINGVYLKLGKGNTKGSMVGSGGIWRHRALLFSRCFKKNYANLWSGRNQVIPIQ